MSPEQAKGKPVDKRADIWAFGVVLFEMLTGRTPFPGETITDIIAEIVKSQPDWKALDAATPPRIRTLLERCLLKEPRERLRDIGDARLFLAGGSEPAVVAGPVRPSRLVPVLAAGLVVVLIALAAALSGGARLADAAPVRLSIAFLAGSQPQKGQPIPSLAVSPDGRSVVYTAGGGPGGGAQLWLRQLNDYAPTPIAGTGPSQATAGGFAPIARQAFFSPDGKWIGFVTGNVIKKIPLTLGPATIVCEASEAVRGATWTDANEIVFATFGTGGLWRVPANGGTPVKVADGNFHYPDALPGGASVLVTADNDTVEESAGDLAVAVVQLSTGAVTKLFDGGTYARYVPTGHIVFARNGALVAAPFVAATLAVGETRTAVVTDLFMDPAVSSSNYAVSAAGTLVYSPGTADEFKRTIVTIDRDVATPLIKERRYYSDPQLSPQGRYLAVVERAWRDRIWVIDTARETLTRLTSGRGSAESDPVWSRDGREIAFDVDRGAAPGLYVAPADGSRTERLVYASDKAATPTSWTDSGRQIVFAERNAGTGFDLMLLSIDQHNSVRALLQTPFNELQGVVSPDGRLIAFQSDRSGSSQVYVSAFPSMDSTTQVSIDGGITPAWAPDGRRLHFRMGRNVVMAVDMTARDLSGVFRPVAVATVPLTYPTAFVDPMADGRFLAIDGANVAGQPELRVILNWFTDLKAKVR